MKKLLLAIFFTLSASALFAQSIQFGVNAGVNLSNQAFHADNSSFPFPDTKNLTGFHAGALVDIGFKNFSIQPGIIFSTKGYEYAVKLSDNNGNSVGSQTLKTTYNYIEVPVNLLYKIPVGPGKIYLGGGPYFAYALSAKSTQFSGAESASDLYKTYNLFSYPGYERIDYGVNFLAGYQLTKGITVSAGYGLGLGNLTNSTNGSTKNRVISFSVGYFFK